MFALRREAARGPGSIARQPTDIIDLGGSCYLADLHSPVSEQADSLTSVDEQGLRFSSINPTVPDRMPKSLIMWGVMRKQRFSSFQELAFLPGVKSWPVWRCDRDMHDFASLRGYPSIENQLGQFR